MSWVMRSRIHMRFIRRWNSEQLARSDKRAQFESMSRLYSARLLYEFQTNSTAHSKQYKFQWATSVFNEFNKHLEQFVNNHSFMTLYLSVEYFELSNSFKDFLLISWIFRIELERFFGALICVLHNTFVLIWQLNLFETMNAVSVKLFSMHLMTVTFNLIFIFWNHSIHSSSEECCVRVRANEFALMPHSPKNIDASFG